MSQGDISISIVNWNGSHYIGDCLKSVYGQDYMAIKEIIVVDNGSCDGSLEKIKKDFPQVKYIENDVNIGFSKAHNQAIDISRGEFILILNFDIILTKNFLSELIKVFGDNKKTGVASGKLYKILDGKKTTKIDTTGIKMACYFPSPRGATEEDCGQYDTKEKRFVFGVCGAAALFRKETLADVKFKNEYFDEDFVNYVEDVDICWRMQLRGWKAVYQPKAVAYHERGYTRKNDAGMQSDYYVKGFTNRYLAIYKNITRYELRKVFFQFLLRELFFLISREGSMPPSAKIKIVTKTLRFCRKTFQEKRKYIQNRIAINPKEIIDFFEYDKLNIINYISKRLRGKKSK